MHQPEAALTTYRTREVVLEQLLLAALAREQATTAFTSTKTRSTNDPAMAAHQMDPAH